MNAQDLMTLLSSTILLSGPLIFAAMGGLTSERSGVINIGLEGKMLIAAAMTAIFGIRTGNPAVGLAAGLAGATLLSMLHYLLTQTYRIDHIISGMAINAIAYGASNFMDRRLMDPNNVVQVPHFGEWSYVTLAILLPFVLWIYTKRTRGGLRLTAVGNDPDKARQMGVSPLRVRFNALLATGVLCGLGGALIVSGSGAYVDQITAGRGFIALAALIIGGWRPAPALAACILFGFFEALQLKLQGTTVAGAKLPPEFWKALPYLATLFAMAGLLGRNRPPSGLGKP